MNAELFPDWYADQYDAGTANRTNHLECASYLEGLRDAMAMEFSQEALQRLDRCVAALRGTANMLDVMRREQTPSPARDGGDV